MGNSESYLELRKKRIATQNGDLSGSQAKSTSQKGSSVDTYDRNYMELRKARGTGSPSTTAYKATNPGDLNRFTRFGNAEFHSRMESGIKNSEGYRNAVEMFFRGDPSKREDRQKWYEDSEKQLNELYAERYSLMELPNYLTGNAPASPSVQYGAAAQAPVAPSDTGNGQRLAEVNEEISRLEAERLMYERGESGFTSKTIDDYYNIALDDSFAQMSGIRDYVNPTREDLVRYDTMMDGSTWYNDGNGNLYDAYGNKIDRTNVDEEGKIIHPVAQGDDYAVKDRLGLYLSASEDEIDTVIGSMEETSGTWESVIKDGFYGNWELLDETEVGIYYAILGTEGQEAADKYLSDMTVELNRRATMNESERLSKAFDEASTLERIGMSVATLPYQAFGAMAGTVENAIYLMQGKDINPYSVAHTGTNYTATVTGKQKQAWDDTGLKIPGLEYTAGDAYQDIMSGLQSLFTIGLAGPTGVTAILAMGAAESDATERYQQGANNTQIAYSALAAAAAEYLWEKMSIENLFKMGDAKTPWQMLGNLAKQGGVETIEESGTEITNLLTNAAIMGQQSDWNKLVEDAGGDEHKAWIEVFRRVAHSGIGGFISGGFMGAGPSIVGYGANRAQDTAVGKEIVDRGGSDALMNLALEMAESASQREAAALRGAQEALARSITPDAYGNINTRQAARSAGKLQRTIRQTVTAQNTADISAGLQEQGFTKRKANQIADALAASLEGRELNDDQHEILLKWGKDERVTKVTESILGDGNSDSVQRLSALETSLHAPQLYTRMRDVKQAIADGRIKEESPAANAQEIETSYDVSSDGKTVYKDKEVQIAGIDSVEGGKLYLKLDDGSVVDSVDVSFSSADEALVYETVANMNISAADANALVEAFRAGDVSANAFALGIQDAVTYGTYGMEYDLANSESTSALTEQQRKTAYQIGQRLSQEKTKAAAEKRTRGARKAKPAKGYKNVSFVGTISRMGSKRKADLKFLDFIASEFSGNNVYVFESYVQNGKRVYKDANGFVKEAPNGMYMANGDIYIDLNAGMEGEGFVLNTFAHELTHHIRDWSPTKFKALADFLVKEYGKAGQSVDELVHARMARSNLNYDAAFEEVVADSMEKMFTDGNIMDKLTKLKAQDKGLLQRIKNFIDKWLSKIKEFYSAEGQYVTREGELAHQLEKFEQLQQLFAEALADAGDSYQTAEKNASNEAPEGIDSTQDTRMFSERRTFKNGQNARGEFIADVLIDLADINSKWWTGVYNHAILGMSKTDDTEFRQFYQEILKRTQDMEEYGKTNQATIEDSFIVQDGKGKEYIYQVSLDGYLHGVVLAKTNKAKYVAALRRATKGGQKYGQSASNIKRRTRNARSNMGRAGSSNGGNNRSNGNLGSSGLGSGTPKSNNQGNNNRGASSNQGVQNQPKLKKSDRIYMDAIKRGDMETAQRMVDEAARKAWYDAEMFHETDADNIHIFDISRGDHGGRDYQTPYGIFTKTSAKNIGLGSKQMRLFVKAHNTLRVKNREDVVNKIPGFVKFYDQIQAIDKKYDAIANKLEDEELDAFYEWAEEHPDADMDAIYPNEYIIEGKPADIDDPKYLAAHERYQQNMAEWESAYNAVAVKAKAYITDYLRSNDYDSMYFVVDGGSFGRQTDSLIVLDENQVKSTDPVTYDDNGNVIPLSERFNQEKKDIRYSYRGKNVDGIEVYETSEAIKKLPYTERIATFIDIMKKQFVGRTAKFTKNGQVYYARFDEADINKNVYGDKKSDKDGWKAKINVGADGNVFELVENARYDGSSNESGKKIAAHKNVSDWDYYIKTVQIDNKVFDLVANVRKTVYDAYVYSIQLNRNKNKKASPPLGLLSKASNGVTNASNKTVPQPASGVNTHSNRNSDRTGESISNRSLLANAFESMAQNDIERQKIAEYKSKIETKEAEERKLRDLKEQIKEMSFAKGPRDTAKLRSLREEAIKTANRLSIYDGQLLRLEASKPLQNVLLREKKKAYDRAKAEGKQAKLASMEGRNKTAMRHKIQNVVGELNRLLLTNDKKHHVPDSLKKAVADALSLVNMDTVGAEERAAKYADLIAKETDPDKIDAYTVTMENLLRQGEKMGQRLKELRDAYEEIQNSDDPDIANAYDPVIAGSLNELSQSIGNTSLRNMSLAQLQDVYDMYRMVLTRVRDANKSLIDSIKESITERASKVIGEVRKAGGEHKYRASALDPVKKFSWNNLKPVYAMERIGSSTLTEAYNNVRAGEDTWAKDVVEAREYYLDKSKKYGYDSWDFEKKYTFESTSGVQFELTLEQIMALYAYSKRDQAGDHLRLGGFVFDSNIETRKETVKGKDGTTKKSLLKYKVNTADAHQISADILADITGSLTKDQRAFVDEMQDYLSTVMGAKGNEVTMKMYGVKLFKEKFYFPLKSAKQFMFEQNEVSGEVRIKNSGFTNKTKPNANNPIILNNFMDVWANHVNDMSMYHSFVLPLEDFNRIFNYNSPKTEGNASVSVKGTIQNAYDPAAVSYVKQLITDLNGGAVSDPRETVAKSMLAKFKKAKVFSSLSVVIQQPSAIGRAFALIHPKYFKPTKDGMNHAALWDELKKYAPVAIIKEMGYFDTNMGKSTQDFINGKEYSGLKEKAKAIFTDGDYRDEVLSKAPALADELAWCAIWNAVKRETVSTHKNLRPGSEAFLKAAGERFTEVITKTQVYDSVLARSANMRSKSGMMSMVTSFMAEPTTTINMIEDALIKAKKGNKGYAVRAFASVALSIFLNNALVAIVYAMRDDDEDETFVEKYAQALASGLLDDANPLNYYPYLKDMWSLFQGYDIERSDMSLVSDLADAAKRLVTAYSTEDGDLATAWWDIAGSVANLGGIPVNNIRRDVKGAINLFDTLAKDMSGRPTTGMSLRDALDEATRKSLPVVGWLPGDSKADNLYDAIIKGDTAYVNRLRATYKDEDAYDSAVRKALRDNDPRIRQAAEAELNGDPSERVRIARLIIADGFDQDNVVAAINAEYNAIKPKDNKPSEDKVSGFYDATDFAVEIGNGNQTAANAARVDIIQTAQKNGKTKAEAEASFESSAKTALKKEFLAGGVTSTQALNALTTYCGDSKKEAERRIKEWEFEDEHGFAYGECKQQFLDGNLSVSEAKSAIMSVEGKTADEAAESIADWEFEGEYGFAYDDKKQQYLSGNISEHEMRTILMDVGGKTAEEADLQIEAYDWVAQGYEGATPAAVRDYHEYCEQANVPKDTYLHIRSFANNTENDKDENGNSINYSAMKKIMAEIDAQPGLTAAQKTAIARSLGWKDSSINRFKPW